MLQSGSGMAGKIRHLLHRDGRYYARRVVPEPLRSTIGKNELRRPLGSDRRTAVEQLPFALASIGAQLDHARVTAGRLNAAAATASLARQAPMDSKAIASQHYLERLALDQELRNVGPNWSSIGINDLYVAALRRAIAGQLTDDEMQGLLGDILGTFAARGNLVEPRGSTEWRQIARLVADAELAALAKVADRDEGIPSMSEEHPAHLMPPITKVVDEPFVAPVSLRQLLDQHICSLEAAGRGRAARKAWPRVFEDLLQFLKGHRSLKGKAISQADNALALTSEEVIAWRDEKLVTLSQKTVKDVYLASLKSALGHAVEDRKLPSNVAATVKVRMSAAPRLREKGFSDTEANSILQLCLGYAPAERENPANRESAHITAAKRWGPWLSAHTGARIGELLQLRKSDVRQEGKIDYLHITPEAGTVKSRSYRDVPLHDQLVELGFLDFVAASPDGPLFFTPVKDEGAQPAQTVAGRLSTWLRKSGVVPPEVAPSHGWRHRFKTLSREARLDPAVVDAIQGHSGRTASDGYGHVTLATKKAAISLLPFYAVQPSS
jgi:integrase